ncbi:MAG: RNA polymerase sigma factor RpoH [Coxiellaceae bacterium]|nr:RNA polymerase sigma factor RpoH [Coxiellaceae bacterium]
MTKDLLCLDRSLSVGTLSSYIHWVNTIPLLTKEEEVDLATKLRDFGDLEAARKMVMSHLRLVVRMARGYSGYGLSQEDLIQEGNIGLMKAVKRFNPDVGVRLVSFAIHWIRAEMHEYILKNWRIVKIATTKAQRKLFFNLRKASKKLGWLSQSEIETVANELNVSKSDVVQMEARLSNYDQSLDVSAEDNEDSKNWLSVAPGNALEDLSCNPEQQVSDNEWGNKQESALYEALDTLDDRSRAIIANRWLSENKKTLHELAAEYQISAERVRQLEKNAMKKMQLAMGEVAGIA